MEKGTALIRFGKTLYLRYGNWLRRVPIDMVIPDTSGLEQRLSNEFDPEQIPPDDEEERFNEDVSVKDLSKDLSMAEENSKLKDTIVQLKEELSQKVRPCNHAEEEAEDNEGEVAAAKDKKALRRQRQKEKKVERNLMPTLGQQSEFREVGGSNWIRGKICGVYKKSSIHRKGPYAQEMANANFLPDYTFQLILIYSG